MSVTTNRAGQSKAGFAGEVCPRHVRRIDIGYHLSEPEDVERMIELRPRSFRRKAATPSCSDESPTDLDLRRVQIQRGKQNPANELLLPP